MSVRRRVVDWTVGTLLVVGLVWGGWSTSADDDDESPPPSQSPGNTGRWEYGNEAPEPGDVGIEPDCDASGCYP